LGQVEDHRMRAPMLVLLAASAALLAGCASATPPPGNGSPPQTEGVALSASPTTRSAPATDLNEVGKTASNGGITLTVTDARTSDTIETNETNSRNTSSSPPTS
jgi:type IV pilus biogenesis protein CpaD/CtpE